MKSAEEHENSANQRNAPDPANDIETVGNKNENKEPVPDEEGLEQKKPDVQPGQGQDTTAADPAADVETVTSKNDNMEPVPDKDQLKQKKS